MNTLLNPKGRIGPVAFRNAAIVLIVIGAVLSLLPLVQPALTTLSYISLVLIYPWFVIWVKRFHDAGKSGWMFLLVLVVWLIVSVAASLFIAIQYAPHTRTPTSGDLSSILANMSAQTQAAALPSAIVSAVISLAMVLVGNALMKKNPGTNACGPPQP